MPQQFWRVENPDGPPYEVGLYHGQESGHLIIYVGSRIISISFTVAQTKRYTFYLGNTLYELIADLTAGKWNYALRDVPADALVPPENTDRPERFLRSDIFKLLFILLLLFLFLIFCVFYKP